MIIINLVRAYLFQQRQKKITAKFGKRFWDLVQSKGYRIALLGDRTHVSRLLKCSNLAQPEAVHQIIYPNQIASAVSQLRLNAGSQLPEEVDCLVILDQPDKRELREQANRFLQDEIPIYVLFDDSISKRLLRETKVKSRKESRKEPLPEHTYIVASSRRTGSSLLCSLLGQTGVAGYPDEYIEFKVYASAQQERIDAGEVLVDSLRVNQTENRMFGLKLHWSDLDRFQRNVVPQLTDKQQAIFQDLLEDSAYIHLTRRDKIRQAISDWRAHQTSVYYVHHDDEQNILKNSEEVQYSYQKIKAYLEEAIESEASWRIFFARNGIEPLTISYEELVEDPQMTTTRVLDHLQLSKDALAELKIYSKKQADEHTEVLYEQFVSDLIEEYGTGILAEVVESETSGDGELGEYPNREFETGVSSPISEQPVAQKEHVLVALATTGYLDMAKQFFASAYFNGQWDGDYLLLAHEIPETELTWFREKGILIYHCDSLYPEPIGGMHPCMASKYYMFTSCFKQWKTVIYSDLDAIVRAPLEGLKNVQGFAAVEDWSVSLYLQVVNKEDISQRDLDSQRCRDLLKQAEKDFNLNIRAFCAGFFVFSTDIIYDGMMQDLQNITDKYEPISKYGDQFAVNLFFYHEWQKLPPTYNILVRKRRTRNTFETGFLSNWETRWGKAEDLDAYILHIFRPNPWEPNSAFYLEWLSNFRKAEGIDLDRVPAISEERLQLVQVTTRNIHKQLQRSKLMSRLGPLETMILNTQRFLDRRRRAIQGIIYELGS